MVTYIVTKLQNSFDKPRSYQHLQILLPLLGFYLSLAFFRIGHQSLWEDEYSSFQRVTFSAVPIWKDGHGFLYYALLYVWVQLGTSEFILRSLSVFFGAAAVCLIYALARNLLNRRAAVIAATVFATSPFLIWYSQEVRYITLMIACTLLAMYTFNRLIVCSFRWWLPYGVTALLAFFSFLATLFLPIIQGLSLLAYRCRPGFLKKWVLCHVVVFTLFGWWFVNGTHFWQAFVEAKANQQTVRNNPKLLPFSGDWNNVRLAVLPYTFFAFSGGFSLGPPPRELYADRTFSPLLPYAPILFVLSVLYGGLLLSGLLALKGQRDAGMFLILWIAVPVLGVFAIAKFLNLFYDVRYVAMALPAYVLLLAAGIARFRRLVVQLALLGAVLAVQAVALGNYYFDPKYAREDTRSAARFLEVAAGSQDLALVVGTVSSLPHYHKGPVPIVDFRSLDGATESLTRRLEKIAADHHRLWLVQIRPWQVDRAGRVKAALDKSYDMVEHQHFPGIDVHGYKIAK